MLPYLSDRPLNLWRWPDGVTGQHFWQKQIPTHAPKWIARWDYPEAGSTESHTYLVADRVATMAWLANHATIDLHPWTSTVDDYTNPTYALIDIDPGRKTTWEEVAHAGPALPRGAGAPQGQGVCPRRRASAASRSGCRSSRSTPTARRAPGWRALAGRRRRRSEPRQLGVGQVVAPAAWRGSTSRRTPSTRRSSRPTRSDRWQTPGVSAPIEWDELDDPDLRPGRLGHSDDPRSGPGARRPLPSALEVQQELPASADRVIASLWAGCMLTPRAGRGFAREVRVAGWR